MSKRRKPQQRTPREWQPMMRASIIPKTPEQMRRILEAAVADGVTEEQMRDHLDPNNEVWKNDRYTAHVDRFDTGEVSCLSIKRNDRKPIHDWRDMQRIKNDIAGPDAEGIEIYPAEDRLVDTANQYFIWCLPPGERVPAGFRDRKVQGPEKAAGYGAVQRAF